MAIARDLSIKSCVGKPELCMGLGFRVLVTIDVTVCLSHLRV